MVATTASTTVNSHGTVLIVEDERISRRALAMLLGSYGYSISEVATAEEAVRLIRSGSLPEIAVVDLDLPGMNGLDLISVLEKLDPGVYAVLVTGADTDRLDAMLRGRHVDFLRKPVDFRRLLEMLDHKHDQN